MKKQLLLILLMALSPFTMFADEWTDVTYLFLRNPSFSGNNQTGWTCTHSAQAALNVNFDCMEVYNGTFDISQILSDLPKGYYRLSAQAFYRAGSHEVSYWNRQGGSEGLTAVIYAGNNEQIVKSIYDCTFNGVADDLWSPDDNSFYPNWMYSASVQFGNGEYVNSLEFDAKGTLQIGIKNENHTEYDWCIFDNFSLLYHGVLDISVYKTALSKAVKAAQDMQGKIPTDIYNQLMLVTNNYNKNYSTREDYYIAIQAIYEAIDSYASDSSVNGYNDFLTLKSYIQALYNVTSYREDVAGAHETLRQAILNAEKEATIATTAEELSSITENLKNAGIQYVNNASPIGDARFDITFMLANPDLQGIEAWNKADGWYTDQTDGNSQAMVNELVTSDDGIHSKFYEYWSETAKDNNLFTVYQKVNLPVGKYDFTCYAFASGGNSGDGVYFYANDSQCTEVYDSRLSETSMTFRQANSNATEVKIGLKVLSGNTYNWMGIGYARLYKVYDIVSDESAIKANSISLIAPKTTMEVGETMNVSANISPANVTLQEVKWSSSDPFVFGIDKTGRIVAYCSGTAKVIATTLDGSNITKELTITVTENIQEDTRTWTDMSSVITNNSFEVRGNSDGWTIERDGGTSEVRSGCLEFWNNNHFKTTQLIENLPQGHYRLSVQAYHRYGNCKRDYTQLQKGEPTSLAYLFVKDNKQTLAPFCSYFERTQPSDEWISPDNGKHWMPNTMESASEAFAKDAYWNYLEFDVEKTVEDVTIGIGLDEYTKENWCIFTNFKLETNVEIDLGKTYTLSVQDESGNDISNKVTIHWYDGQGNELGNGSSIGGVKKGAELYYSVSLDESLGKQYREVIKQKANLEEETIICRLLRIEEVILHGKVQAYGTALYRAEVSLTQWLNGKHEYTASTMTDANGEFTLNAYNDSTELIVTANGYIDNKIIRRKLYNGGELGSIEMVEVLGKVIALNLSYQEATHEGLEPNVQNWYSDTRNIEYMVQNITKGHVIEDFAIQQGNIVMPTGTDHGDKIQVTVRSLNEKFAEVTAEGIIADNDTAYISINLLAFGGIEATYGQKSDDNLLAMLYDSNGKLQMRTVCASSRLTFTDLAAGTYSLVTMGYNGAIGSVADISDLANLDLAEGRDYVRSTANVLDGYISSINVASVPELDASKFEYTGMNTSYMPNKTQLVAGNFITLTVRLDFKEQYSGKTDNVKVVVEIPEGCEFVPNSVVIGAKPIPHSLNGDKLTITIDKEDLDRRIRFCVIPIQTGTYLTSAYAEFDYKGTKIQPIGQIRFESTSGELYVPSTTKTSYITLGGIGVPKADVEVYDNDALIGTTRSLGNGKWSLSCELNNAYNLSTHSIYVKYYGEGNVFGLTEAKECFFDINAIVPKSVTMVNTAHPAGNLTPKVYETVFDFETFMAIQNYYLYWPNYPEFTFLIDLSENDTTKVSDVNLYVHTTDGDKRKLPAEFNGKLNRFVATSSFDMYSLPVNVSVDFSVNSTVQLDADVFRNSFEALNTSKEAFSQNVNELNDLTIQVGDVLVENEIDTNLLSELLLKSRNAAGMYSDLLEMPDFSEMTEEEVSSYVESLLLSTEEIIDDNMASFVENYFSQSFDEALQSIDGIEVLQNTATQEELREEGYVEFNLTDSSSVFVLATETEYVMIDFVNNRKISFDLPTFMHAKSRRFASDDFISTMQGYLDFTKECGDKLRDYFNRVASLVEDVLDVLGKKKVKLDEKVSQLDYAIEWIEQQPYKDKPYWKDLLKKYKIQRNNALKDAVSNSNITSWINKNFSPKGLRVGKIGGGIFSVVDAGLVIVSACNDIGRVIGMYKSIPEPCRDDQGRAKNLRGKVKNTGKAAGIYYAAQLASDIVQITSLFYSVPALIPSGGTSLGLVAASVSLAVANFLSCCAYEKIFKNRMNEHYKEALSLNCLRNCGEIGMPPCPPPPGGGGSGGRGCGSGTTPNQDPSGFVYEAVPTNRLQDVIASVFYLENDSPVFWNAEEFDEINPQITDVSGLYAWDVPQGMWKVLFEKEGYETTQTDWLPVPPPQLEINIPMSQAVAPFVVNVMGSESGITLDFSKYMKPNTLTKSSHVTVACNGENIKGDVELLNLEDNPFNNEEYASKIKFVPMKSFKTTDEVIITVKKEVESYAGKQMTEDFVQRVKIESEITDIVCDSVIVVDYQGTGVFELSVLPATAAKGRTIQVASTSSMIASTDAQNVTLNEEGKAQIVVSGDLPGNASLHLSIPDAGKEKFVVVSVVTKEEQIVKTPKASKLSGSSFEDSYLLTLTCATKGATIYYTLDGSCPCDEQTRKKYTGPISLPEGQVTLKAIAVREGMADSDIAVFTYMVVKDEANGIRIIEESHDFEASYQDGSIVIFGAMGASCHIYDLQGRELASRNKLSSQTRINVPKTGVYIVSVLFSDEQTVVHKIMVR